MNELRWDPATRCRHPYCRDTNWGGRDRVHIRDEVSCPPDPDGKYLIWQERDKTLPPLIIEEEPTLDGR